MIDFPQINSALQSSGQLCTHGLAVSILLLIRCFPSVMGNKQGVWVCVSDVYTRRQCWWEWAELLSSDLSVIIRGVCPHLRASSAFISSIRPPLPPLVRLASLLAPEEEFSSGWGHTARSGQLLPSLGISCRMWDVLLEFWFYTLHSINIGGSFFQCLSSFCVTQVLGQT